MTCNLRDPMGVCHPVEAIACQVSLHLKCAIQTQFWICMPLVLNKPNVAKETYRSVASDEPKPQTLKPKRGKREIVVCSIEWDVRLSRDCVVACVAVCCSVLQCVAVCCSVLQCVAVCCSVLQCSIEWDMRLQKWHSKCNRFYFTHVPSRHEHLKSTCYDWMSHITHMKESCHTYKRVTSHKRTRHITHTKEWCKKYEWALSRTWM